MMTFHAPLEPIQIGSSTLVSATFLLIAGGRRCRCRTIQKVRKINVWNVMSNVEEKPKKKKLRGKNLQGLWEIRAMTLKKSLIETHFATSSRRSLCSMVSH